MSTLRTLMLLSGNQFRRLCRRPQTTRILFVPPQVVIGTFVLATLAILYLQRVTPVSIHPDSSPALVQAIERAGYEVSPVSDPLGALHRGDTWAAVIHDELVFHTPSQQSVEIEAAIRTQLDSPWKPAAPPRTEVSPKTLQVSLILSIVYAFFSLYGVVIGAGMISMDTESGLLDVERSLPVPRWVHPTSRWLAASGLLWGTVTLSTGVIACFLGITDAGSIIRHGGAAASIAVTIGIAAMGFGHRKRTFSSSLAAGLSSLFGLFGLGLAAPVVGQLLPVASLTAGGPGWIPAAVSVLCSLVVLPMTERSS